MTAPPDALLAGSSAVPSLFGAALRLTAFAVLLAAGSWALLRWRRRVNTLDRRLAVVDRAALSRGASVALLRVEGRHLLVGVAGDGVRLLRDFGPAAEAAAFRHLLAESHAQGASVPAAEAAR
jgi:flagellar biogenesis protein FliO